MPVKQSCLVPCHHMAVINRVGSGSSSRGSGRGSGEDFKVYNCHENHLLHLHKGAGLNRDARRGKPYYTL